MEARDRDRHADGPDPGRAAAMARCRKTLLAAMLPNANRCASYYGLLLAQVVEVGLEMEI